MTYLILPCRKYNCNIFKHKGEKYIEQYIKNQICNYRQQTVSGKGNQFLSYECDINSKQSACRWCSTG